ncbi:hypothetical protein Tco_0707041 [Tanacetum coccineum]|uniref:Reverse transcriptase domain-containing protein n=1 Tax=Tanacetum coccineum TaxID=301880 RepID=A0ABQ4YB70_9ASTR
MMPRTVMPCRGWTHVDDKLQFVEGAVENIDREVKKGFEAKAPHSNNKVVEWKLRKCPEFTWERSRSTNFGKKYPHLFKSNTPSTSATS